MSIPDFADDAECRKLNLPTKLFIHDPEDEKHEHWEKVAKLACARCPVKAECFLFGITNKEQGVWGGVWLDDDTHNDK